MDWLMNPWPWYVSGSLVGLIMLTLVWLGKTFGFSSNFRTICAALGAGKSCSFFQFNWKAQQWNLLFLLDAVIGGFLAAHVFAADSAPDISFDTSKKLAAMGFTDAGSGYFPAQLFGTFTLKNLLIWSVGGLLIGFGTRYAGGCTSGHAITGLSDLQLPSLLAVIGFFIGGLMMIHMFFPLLF